MRLTVPAIVGDVAYLSSGDGSIVAVDLVEQREVWRVQPSDEALSVPLVVGDPVLIGTFNGGVWALDAATPLTPCGSIEGCCTSTARTDGFTLLSPRLLS